MNASLIMAVIEFVGDMLLCAGLIAVLVLLAMRITGRS
jgi:hypothetical protein